LKSSTYCVPKNHEFCLLVIWKKTERQNFSISLFVWLVADGWCWFILREKYYWLVGGGWFVVREKYCWLVADKPCEQGGQDKVSN
jgi:hypothetical protein